MISNNIYIYIYICISYSLLAIPYWLLAVPRLGKIEKGGKPEGEDEPQGPQPEGELAPLEEPAPAHHGKKEKHRSTSLERQDSQWGIAIRE